MGNIRHLDTALLWVQHQVREGGVSLEEVAGIENPGDAMTKFLPAPQLLEHMGRMSLVYEEGRAESAPQLTSAVVASAQVGKEVMRAERCKWQEASKEEKTQDGPCSQKCVRPCPRLFLPCGLPELRLPPATHHPDLQAL